MIPAKPEVQQTAREAAHAIICERQQSPWCHWSSNRDDHSHYCDTLTAAIEARDTAHAREVAELRRQVIEECASVCEDASSVGDFYAKRIRSLRGKVEP